MARPKKPPIGTAERLYMDVESYGKTYRFIRDEIRKVNGARGSRTKAIEKAAKKFCISLDTAERHYERMRKLDTPESLGLVTRESVRRELPGFVDSMSLIRSAFTPDEMEQLGTVGGDVMVRLEKERLELTELRKRRKRK